MSGPNNPVPPQIVRLSTAAADPVPQHRRLVQRAMVHMPNLFDLRVPASSPQQAERLDRIFRQRDRFGIRDLRL